MQLCHLQPYVVDFILEKNAGMHAIDHKLKDTDAGLERSITARLCNPSDCSCFGYYLAPRRGRARYCNQPVCLSVCLFVCLSVCVSVCTNQFFFRCAESTQMGCIPPHTPMGILHAVGKRKLKNVKKNAKKNSQKLHF